MECSTSALRRQSAPREPFHTFKLAHFEQPSGRRRLRGTKHAIIHRRYQRRNSLDFAGSPSRHGPSCIDLVIFPALHVGDGSGRGSFARSTSAQPW